LLCELDRFMFHAGKLRAALAAGDGAAVEAMMARARDARGRWLAGEFDAFRDESA
jgi:prephenate dehydrogenase